MSLYSMGIKKVTIVNALYCNVCDTTIYSRAHHDYHHCKCDNDDYALMCDGGLEYARYGWGGMADMPEMFPLKVKATKEQLYDDWNKRRNKYGWIKGNAKTKTKRKAKVQKG